ncbi:hypothetical protein JTB14_030309 [Gonioctena quinquepunctata]|nr:hypothetical protein JTB14_030309 [Gonioctena quinquepunctata]
MKLSPISVPLRAKDSSEICSYKNSVSIEDWCLFKTGDDFEFNGEQNILNDFELLKTHTGNLIVSPFSAETVLALTHEGAKGDSAAEMVSGLSLPNTKEKIQQAFKSFLPKLKKSDEDLKLLSANKIYVGADVKLEDSFKQTAEQVYNSGVENVDFAENVATSSKINKWVEDQTNEKIKDLIKSDDIDGDTKLILINALYFSGKWQNQFEKYATQKKKFYKSENDTVDVHMMHQTDYFKYYENPILNAKFLELQYQGSDDVSMVIVLPNEKDGLTAVEENIEEILAPQPMKMERVDIQLPRFTIESEIKFVPILKNLGINKVFDGEQSDLSGLSSTHKNLVISDVIQKAFINVTESGTEAAAATAVIVPVPVLSLPFRGPTPKVFHADHGFIYIISVENLNVFIGRLN